MRTGLLAQTFRICSTALALCLGLNLIPASAIQVDSGALWRIVHDLCVPNERQRGEPYPCAMVQLRDGEQHGYVLLKDRVGATQFLLIPTARIAGIESSAVLAPDAPNYFAIAWETRTHIDSIVHRALPRDDIALAINSVSGRSQNQLHIHIDCVRFDVRDALRDHEASIRDGWALLSVPLAGHLYMAMRVEGEQLDRANPFTLLADGVPGAREDMGQHTLVVVGAIFSSGHPGFIILDDHVDPASGDRASGEELQDHSCAIAKP
jgi:CDP-diacylglycerol pyrophosphatase